MAPKASRRVALSAQEKALLARTSQITGPPSLMEGAPPSSALQQPPTAAGTSQAGEPQQQAASPTECTPDDGSHLGEAQSDDATRLDNIKRQLREIAQNLGPTLAGTLLASYVDGLCRRSGASYQLVREQADRALGAAVGRLLNGPVPMRNALAHLEPFILCMGDGAPKLFRPDPNSSAEAAAGLLAHLDMFSREMPVLFELLSKSTPADALSARADPQAEWLYAQLVIQPAEAPTTAVEVTAVEASAVPPSASSLDTKETIVLYFGLQEKRKTPTTLVKGRPTEETGDVRHLTQAISVLRSGSSAVSSRKLAAVSSNDPSEARCARYKIAKEMGAEMSNLRVCGTTEICLQQPQASKPPCLHTARYAARRTHAARRTPRRTARHTAHRSPQALLAWVPLRMEAVAAFFHEMGVKGAKEMTIEALEALLVLLGESYSDKICVLNMRMNAGALLATYITGAVSKSLCKVGRAALLVAERPGHHGTATSLVLQMMRNFDGSAMELYRLIAQECVTPLGYYDDPDLGGLLTENLTVVRQIEGFVTQLAESAEAHDATDGGAAPPAYWLRYPEWGNGKPLPSGLRCHKHIPAAPLAMALRMLEKSQGASVVESAALAMLREEFASDRGWKPTEGFDETKTDPNLVAEKFVDECITNWARMGNNQWLAEQYKNAGEKERGRSEDYGFRWNCLRK